MKTILLIALLLSVTLCQTDPTLVTFQGDEEEETEAFVDTASFITTANTSVTGYQTIDVNTTTAQVFLFWFKTGATGFAADTADVTPFEIFTLESANADTFLTFNLGYLNTGDVFNLIWFGETVNGAAVGEQIWTVALADIAKITTYWTLAWVKLDNSATVSVTCGYNATPSTNISNADFDKTDTTQLTVAKFITDTIGTGFTSITIDGFRQYTGVFDPTSLVCDEAEFDAGQYYGQACDWAPPSTKKSSGQLYYISIFIMMILISLLY